MQKFFGFDTLVSTDLIKATYVLIQLVLIPMSFEYPQALFGTTGFSQNLGAGIIFFLVASMLWRFSCEGIVVFFKIYERLEELTESE